MKKLWIAALLGLMLALSGCGGEKTEDAEEAAAGEEGQYKIEIFTAESTAVPVNTTEDPTARRSGAGVWTQDLEKSRGKL